MQAEADGVNNQKGMRLCRQVTLCRSRCQHSYTDDDVERKDDDIFFKAVLRG